MTIKTIAVSLDSSDRNRNRATRNRLLNDLNRSKIQIDNIPKKKNSTSSNCGIA
jgi:hypothetical protein